MKVKRFITSTSLRITIPVVFLLLFLTCLPSQAEEVRYPVPCYEGKELAKVKQWEKKWVGKKITSGNIDEVKDLMLGSMYQIMKDPVKWQEIWFEIVPYRQLKPTKGEIKATKKYAGTCRIGHNDELENWIHGIPFPNPKTGIEIAYNFDCATHGDNLHMPQKGYVVDGKRKYDRHMVMNSNMMWFSGRVDVPPVPEFPRNPKNIRRASHTEYVEPASLKGGRGMQIKWKDDTKDFGSWSFSFATRRIKRRSTAQRSDTLGGGEFCYDDNYIYDFGIPFLKYKYLGRKELILARHQDLDLLEGEHKEGRCLANGVQREMINTYVVEAIHVDPNYIYSKQIWYVDPESWFILTADKFDHKGRMWKLFEQHEYLTKLLYNNEPIPYIGTAFAVDVQRVHSSIGVVRAELGGSGYQFEPTYYTVRALQRYGY